MGVKYMSDEIKEGALRLLRAMNYHQAKGRTDVAVGPDPEIVREAGLEQGSYLLEAAMWWLLDENALEHDYEINARASSIVGLPDYGIAFFITEHGLDLLR